MIMCKSFEQIDLFKDSDFFVDFLDGFKTNSERLVDFFDCYFFALVVFFLHKNIQTGKSLHYSEKIGFEVVLWVSFEMDVELFMQDYSWTELSFENLTQDGLDCFFLCFWRQSGHLDTNSV